MQFSKLHAPRRVQSTGSIELSNYYPATTMDHHAGNDLNGETKVENNYVFFIRNSVIVEYTCIQTVSRH